MKLLVRAFLCLILGGCAAASAHAGDSAPANKEAKKTSPRATASLKPSQNSAVKPMNADKRALNELINSVSNKPTASRESIDPSESSVAPPSTIELITSDAIVPTANELWQLSDKQCMTLLEDAQIKTHRPKFATPFVRTPLILDSPIEGVTIDTRWPTEPHRKVMDCRLIVSLIQLARRAKVSGVVKIQYYSTWRPIKPMNKCGKGKKGTKCKKVFERAQKGHVPSQHSRATAIDIRWFTFEDETIVDVFEHYEMNFHEPPCEDTPVTVEGQFLKNLACDLHTDKAFNVMLTPNADRDHANHFHFDITPNVKWYIIR